MTSRLALRLLCSALVALGTAPAALAQVAVQAQPDHAALLASADPHLAANKRLVYDFWREVLEAGHLDLAPKFLDAGYIQHNPNVPSGRDGFVAFFAAQGGKPQAIAERVAAPLVAITAEGDRVVMSFASRRPDPAHPGSSYTTTWFDMFRIADGKIAEHWDCAPKQATP
jgi:predicted SnoaL-like aldol condensation-catalyzing enzyme